MNRRQPINLCISESREGREEKEREEREERERERGGGRVCVLYIVFKFLLFN